MFSHAVKHHKKKADIEARNKQNLSPLTLASKLGRVQLFNEIIHLHSYVSFLSVNFTVLFNVETVFVYAFITL